MPRGNKIKGGAPARASALVGERLSVVDVGDDGKISDFRLVGQKNTPPKDGKWSSNIGVYPQEIPGGQAAGASPRPTEQGNDRGPGRRTGSPSPTHTRGDRLGISGAWHRWRPGGRSRYSAAALRACGVTAMRAARGAASSAQATDRSLPGRPESSFPPLGLLSPPNPLRSRWRLCRLTDAACPLRVLRWASAGAPVTASASQWGGRQCTPGLCKPDTAHRRHEPPFRGAPGEHPRPLLSPHFFGKKWGRPPRRRRRGRFR